MKHNNIYQAPESLFTPAEPEKWSGWKLLFMTLLPSLIYLVYHVSTGNININREILLVLVSTILFCATWTGLKMAKSAVGTRGISDGFAYVVIWLLIHCATLFFLSVIVAMISDYQKI